MIILQALFVALTVGFIAASYTMIDRMGSIGFGSIEPTRRNIGFTLFFICGALASLAGCQMVM